jgi:hypothetical protein
MTTIPTVERTEQTKCNVCERDCIKLCTRCGKNFCKMHLLEHSERCGGYKSIVRAILHDDIVEITRQIFEVMLRTI